MNKDAITTPHTLQSLPRRQINLTFFGVLLAMFLGSLDQTIVGTAMPRIIADLGGFRHYTLVATAYIIASAVTVPIIGKLTDMYGRKYFYMAGLIIFISTSAVCGISHTMTQLIIWRSIQGIGAGIMMANAFIVIGDIFPPAVRGKYIGFISAVFGLSSIIGPTLGGVITDTLSWHWIFFINIPLGIVVIFLFGFFFPNLRPDNQKHSIDFAGIVTLILTIVPAMLALSLGGVDLKWSSASIIGLLTFSLIMLTALILIENRSREPILPLEIYKDPIVALSQVTTLLTGFCMFGSIIFIPLYFQGVLGASATVSGSFLTPMMLGIVLGSSISGQFLSRTGGHYKWQGNVGIVVMAVGMFLISRMTADTSYTQAVVNIAATGFGMGITMPLYIIATQNVVPYKMLGVATSATAFSRSLGGSLGLAVLGTVMNRRFTYHLVNRLPVSLKNALAEEHMNALVNNPRALIDPESQKQFAAVIDALDVKGEHLFGQLLATLRQSLASAISDAFYLAMIVLIFALVANACLKEIPLRKQHSSRDGRDI